MAAPGANPEECFVVPDVAVAVGEERIAAQRELQALLRKELEDRQAALDRKFESLMRGSIPYFRDSAIALDSPRAAGVYRTEDSAFRQVMRLTEMLLKLKNGSRKKTRKNENEGTSHDVDENKGQVLESHDLLGNK